MFEKGLEPPHCATPYGSGWLFGERISGRAKQFLSPISESLGDPPPLPRLLNRTLGPGAQRIRVPATHVFCSSNFSDSQVPKYAKLQIMPLSNTSINPGGSIKMAMVVDNPSDPHKQVMMRFGCVSPVCNSFV